MLKRTSWQHSNKIKLIEHIETFTKVQLSENMFFFSFYKVSRKVLPGNVVRVKLYNHVAIGVTKKGTRATKISSIAKTDPNSFGGRS